jgi:CheY-like chemotaxis protein
MVRGDADRLLQVFWNLLSNAVKFTNSGGRVSARLAAAEDGVRVSVIDTGVGISRDFMPHVFQRFKQADPSAARRHGGLGLGLALVREIVHLHGGSVTVDSGGPDAGTTFIVSLPARRVTRRHSVESSATTPELRGVHILVVEDDPDAREIVSTTITDAGASVTAVASVAEALGALRDQRSERPQAVVADIGMPGADGFALLNELRRMPPEQGGSLPVIAVTAYATSEDRRSALHAGFYAHVAKPFAAENLISTIARAVHLSV